MNFLYTFWEIHCCTWTYMKSDKTPTKLFQDLYCSMFAPMYGFSHSEAVVQRCSVRKLFWKISQSSQENTCARVFFLIKLQASTCNFIKGKLWQRCFLVKFLRTPFLQSTSGGCFCVLTKQANKHLNFLLTTHLRS